MVEEINPAGAIPRGADTPVAAVAVGVDLPAGTDLQVQLATMAHFAKSGCARVAP